ncbi:hypothetical protein [Camelimonas lactis]|uniref:hypothetical protein n=1 Tax=Camelimonas lactis TaxID=659006 RepID=UPI0010519D95|nr:hypothetical protein [Camelimonas lactis]
MTWLLANWRIGAAAGVLAALALAAWRINDMAYERGKASVVADQITKERRLTDDANRADADARRCAADPACRMQSDGWRRD